MTAPTRRDKKNKSRWRAMCTNLEAAALNRKRVSEGYGNEYWIRLENQLEREEQREIAGIIQIRRK